MMKETEFYAKGDLVEITQDKTRGYITDSLRDCDGTILYSLCFLKDHIDLPMIGDPIFGGLRNPWEWFSGISGSSLELVKDFHYSAISEALRRDMASSLINNQGITMANNQSNRSECTALIKAVSTKLDSLDLDNLNSDDLATVPELLKDVKRMLKDCKHQAVNRIDKEE